MKLVTSRSPTEQDCAQRSPSGGPCRRCCDVRLRSFSQEDGNVESPTRAAKPSNSISCHAKHGKHPILRALLLRQYRCPAVAVSQVPYWASSGTVRSSAGANTAGHQRTPRAPEPADLRTTLPDAPNPNPALTARSPRNDTKEIAWPQSLGGR